VLTCSGVSAHRHNRGVTGDRPASPTSIESPSSYPAHSRAPSFVSTPRWPLNPPIMPSAILFESLCIVIVWERRPTPLVRRRVRSRPLQFIINLLLQELFLLGEYEQLLSQSDDGFSCRLAAVSSTAEPSHPAGHLVRERWGTNGSRDGSRENVRSRMWRMCGCEWWGCCFDLRSKGSEWWPRVLRGVDD